MVKASYFIVCLSINLFANVGVIIFLHLIIKLTKLIVISFLILFLIFICNSSTEYLFYDLWGRKFDYSTFDTNISKSVWSDQTQNIPIQFYITYKRTTCFQYPTVTHTMRMREGQGETGTATPAPCVDAWLQRMKDAGADLAAQGNKRLAGRLTSWCPHATASGGSALLTPSQYASGLGRLPIKSLS